jgi:hypothetical protein
MPAPALLSEPAMLSATGATCLLSMNIEVFGLKICFASGCSAVFYVLLLPLLEMRGQLT